MVKAIYLDNHASTPVDPRVIGEMLPLLSNNCGNPHSSDHIFGWKASQIVEKSRQRIAVAIGADPDEIIFTSGATESNNLAVLGAFNRPPAKFRKKILVGATEHKCVLEAAYSLARNRGAVVEVIPVDDAGVVDVDTIASKLKKDDVLLVSVMSVNNEIGTIQPIKIIGELTRNRDVLFHTDAAQALAAIDIDVFADNVDLLSLSAHKIYGPQGVGALYVRRELQNRIEPILYGGGQQAGLRSGTVPVSLCAGFGAAIEIIGRESVGEREALAKKRDRLFKGLMGKDFAVRLNGPPLKQRHPGNANLLFPGFSNHDIIAALQPRVAASAGSACTSGTPESSYVLRAIGLTDDEASSSIRFSVGRFTTDEDIARAIDDICEVISRLRG